MIAGRTCWAVLIKNCLQPAGIQGFAQCWLLPGTFTWQTAQYNARNLQTVLPHVRLLFLSDTAQSTHRDRCTTGCFLVTCTRRAAHH